MVIRNLHPIVKANMKMFYGLNLRNGQKISDFEASVIETYCFASGLPSPVYKEEKRK